LFEEQIADSGRGLVLSWDGLIGLARGLNQIIDLVIVGVTDVTAIPRLQPGCDLERASEFVVEAIDGWIWRLFSRDEAILGPILERFKDVQVIRA
jgi:hypothetical protein